jgi:proton-dependent oligopeptide transporter, POT family
VYRHPPGLAVLFFTELWERFSYYGMRALLVLFLIAGADQGGFGWTTQDASRFYGWYTGLVYFTPLIGGYLADRFLGARSCVLLGGAIIASGHFLLAFAQPVSFFLGLACVIVGTGFFKANISVLVGRLYSAADPQRDSGYTIFYMGINLGALLGPLVCGYLAQRADLGWHYGFAAAGVGMVIGLMVFVCYGQDAWRHTAKFEVDRLTLGPSLTAEERRRVRALLILSFFVIFFWLAFEQAGTSMTLFAEHHTSRELPDWFAAWAGVGNIPTAWFLSINPAFILLLAPLFSRLWTRLDASAASLDAPLKMALGLSLLSAGFIVLSLGGFRSAGGVLVSPVYLIGAYFLHTCGELCLSPVGLALVSRKAPLQIASLVMGVWFLANFCANLLGGYLAGALEAVARGEYFRLFGGEADFFLIFVVSSGAAALLLFSVRSPLRRLLEAGDGH